ERARIKELAARFGGSARTSLGEVLGDPAIDAVVLTLPNHLHTPVAKQALEAGKHVLVEKPLTTSLADCDALIDIAARSSRILMGGMCRRFFAGARLARERIHELGRPVNIISILGVFSDQPRTSWWHSAADTGGLALG